MTEPLHIISLGAGVQSSTMVLMAAHGEITPMPDAAIFADTGSEAVSTYAYLRKLEKLLPFPVYRVQAKHTMWEDARDLKRWDNAPFWSATGPLFRKCTRHYKVRPLERKQKELMAEHEADQVIAWQGISQDEIQRARMSVTRWCEYRYPLLEQRMTRGHCLEWMQANGYELPGRSACVFCPYHSNEEWQRIKANPCDWAEALEWDALIANGINGSEPLFLHKDRVRLEEADLSTPADHGQQDLFAEECEGMCGL